MYVICYLYELFEQTFFLSFFTLPLSRFFFSFWVTMGRAECHNHVFLIKTKLPIQMKESVLYAECSRQNWNGLVGVPTVPCTEHFPLHKWWVRVCGFGMNTFVKCYHLDEFAAHRAAVGLFRENYYYAFGFAASKFECKVLHPLVPCCVSMWNECEAI